jgi:hypothetical protein
MYDKVTALETYLRNNYTYDTNIAAPPPGTEAASWFLFQSRRGFCNYFATAMTLMARSIGIPARVAAGYTNGKYNTSTNEWDISGTDAHAWTQIYFAGYGWINFEPSATFSQFARPIKPTGTASTPLSPSGSTITNPNRPKNVPDDPEAAGQSATSPTGVSTASQIRQDVGIVLLVLVVFVLGGLVYFGFWWRRLFRELSPPVQVYGRVSVLAGWAGIANRRSQTPREYMLSLSAADPEDAVTFERLGDIYARTRWADQNSPDHPDKTGESGEVHTLWKALRPHLILYILRHPHFLRSVPSRLGGWLRRPFTRRTQPSASTVVIEEPIDQA